MRTKLTQEQIATYRAEALRRQEEDRRSVGERRERAMQIAHLAAKLLRETFGATRVVLFGSLTRPEYFGAWSDVDIAAWGISDKDTFLAIGEVLGVDREIQVNLVDVNYCRPAILASIEKEGIEL